MPKIKQIVVADPSFNFKLLREMGKDTFFHFHYSPLPLNIKALQSAFALLIRTRVPVNEKLLSHSPFLKLIISGTRGKDHIDESACKRRNVHVIFIGQILSSHVAEFTMLLMLQLGWNSISAMETVKKGEWKNHLKKGIGLNKKILGIIGFGAVGRALAERARAFKMTVTAYSPSVSQRVFDSYKVQKHSLERLLKNSDFISLHLPYNKNTKGFFGRSQFSLMKPSSFLINTSRGGIICEDSLIDAIKSKKIQGGALDVFQKEPLPKDSPLRKLQSLILTPHFATHNQTALDLLTKKSFLNCKTLSQAMKNKEF